MRQFDVFVLEEESSGFAQWKPSFEDSALGWFHDSDWNRSLPKIDAEWVVFAHPAVLIDRVFLNSLAEATEGFPMVDAFAPRLRCHSRFYGGLLLGGKQGVSFLDEDSSAKFVAGPHPLLGVFSARIIQRTGLFDMDLPAEFRLVDYALRMAHAGGKMFSLPYLVAGIEPQESLNSILEGHFLKNKTSVPPLWEIIYKNLPLKNLWLYSLRHPTSFARFWGHQKLKFKRDKATALSKFSNEYLNEISL